MAALHYLHLPLRLFIASSGSHDPLQNDYETVADLPATEEEKLRIKHYKIAQIAVRKKDWGLREVKSSEEYLRREFEDDGKADLPLQSGLEAERPGYLPQAMGSPHTLGPGYFSGGSSSGYTSAYDYGSYPRYPVAEYTSSGYLPEGDLATSHSAACTKYI